MVLSIVPSPSSADQLRINIGLTELAKEERHLRFSIASSERKRKQEPKS
jgi:hypothetical protein